MIDYLYGNELRIPFEARDSIFEFYLLEDGTVDEAAIPKIDASYAVGQRLLIKEGAVLEFADLVERLGTALMQRCAKP